MAIRISKPKGSNVQELTDGIEALMAVAARLKKHPDVDKRLLNKVAARLEESWLYSQHLTKSETIADHESLNETAPSDFYMPEEEDA